MTDVAHLPGFSRRNGTLYCEALAVRNLAERFGTPLYLYSRQGLETAAADWLNGIKGTHHRVFFAVKSCSTLAVLRLFDRLGLGFDIVSGGELARCLAAGVAAEKIVYSGVGKTRQEIRAALTAGIGCFNLENPQELDRVQQEAEALGVTANISFRVNPDVDAKTHPYISTGLKDNKFGVSYKEALALYRRAQSLPNIRISGIDCHVGSQITQIEPFIEACRCMLDIVAALKSNGITLDHIDFGGGLGVQYNQETPPTACGVISRMAEICREKAFGDLSLWFEPGRSLSARAGMLAMTVEYLKPSEEKNFCIVDTGMNDMLRPALYQADMAVIAAEDRSDTKAETYDVVGPICESSDWLSKNRRLAVKEGDTLVMTCAGAYGMTMGSNYNTRPRAAEVLVDGGKVSLIRERETVGELFKAETIPAF